MTIVDWIATTYIWVRVVLVIAALYLVTWVPRVIYGFNKVIKQLNLVNQNIEELNTTITEATKQNYNARVSADLLATLLASNNKSEKEKK